MSSKLKAEALRSMTEEQRKATLIDQARLLMDLKVQRATDRLEAISEIRVARRNIARLKTIVHEKVVNERHAAAAKAAQDAHSAAIAATKQAEIDYREIRAKNEKARQMATERKKAGIKNAIKKSSKSKVAKKK
jgi:large subunit ribosomal protein L29